MYIDKLDASQLSNTILYIIESKNKAYPFKDGKFFYARDLGTVLNFNTEEMKFFVGLAALSIDKDHHGYGFGGDLILTDFKFHNFIEKEYSNNKLVTLLYNKLNALKISK